MRGECYLFFLEEKPERSFIERDECRTEEELSLEPSSLERAGGSTNRSNSQIGRKIILFSDFVVKCVVKPDGIGFLIVSSPTSNFRDGMGVAIKEFIQDRDVIGADGDLAMNCADRLHCYDTRESIQSRCPLVSAL